MEQDLTRKFYHDVYTDEYFYTFLKAVVINYKNETYYVWGYREVMNEVVCLSATTDEKTPWTNAIAYTDKDLIKELVNLLPEKPIKKRRRKRK